MTNKANLEYYNIKSLFIIPTKETAEKLICFPVLRTEYLWTTFLTSQNSTKMYEFIIGNVEE